jgi:predicted RNA-binding Zn-ribbon protein involved in translation (DUF1610 family)
MSDETVINMSDGSKWRPSSSQDVVHCVTCGNAVDTPEEIASYPRGSCPQCGTSWTGHENRSTIIQVTMPESITGGAG